MFSHGEEKDRRHPGLQHQGNRLEQEIFREQAVACAEQSATPLSKSRSLSAFAIATAAGRIRERPVIFVHHSTVTIAGEPADFEDVGSSGLKVLRGYCPRCGSYDPRRRLHFPASDLILDNGERARRERRHLKKRRNPEERPALDPLENDIQKAVIV